MPFEEFAEVDRSVFRAFARAEVEEDRDIPDLVRYGELVRTLFPERSAGWRKRAAGRADRAFWRVIVGNYVPEEGVRRSLGELKAMGLRMAVLSNHHDHGALVDHLRQLKLDRYFVRIFSSARMGVRKPNPAAFERCLSALRVESGEAVFVGDSVEKDVGGARASGMRAILVDRGSPGRHIPTQPTGGPSPDFTVGSVSEVPGVIRMLNRERPRRGA